MGSVQQHFLANQSNRGGAGMNCRPDRREFFLASKFSQHLDVATNGINLSDRRRGRKNFLRTLERHPELAARFGYTEQSVPLEIVYG